MICMDNPMITWQTPRMSMIEKREGFPGQRIVVLPRRVVIQALASPLTAGVLPTDVGWFPHARHHSLERPEGAEQIILIHCIRGMGWCRMGTRTHAVNAGELLVVPSGTPHHYGAAEAHPWTIYWMHVHGGLR